MIAQDAEQSGGENVVPGIKFLTGGINGDCWSHVLVIAGYYHVLSAFSFIHCILHL